MGLIIACLAAGVLIGYLRPLSSGHLRVVHYITMGSLVLLLLSMGAQLGGNQQVLADAGRIGLQALVLASLGILGSVLLVWAATGFIMRGVDDDRVKVEAGGDAP